MNGILLINKPVGITSYDVIRELKKILNTKKIGHAGTLDPFASGLLIILVGHATKLSDYFMGQDKTYQGTIVFNNHYDTYDVTGEVIESDNKVISFNELNGIRTDFIGEYMQMPPIYSAIKVDGKKLYEYARANIDVEISKRLVNIKDLNFKDLNKLNEFEFTTSVSSGTYIRSLAVDIATKLNTFGALKTLKRTSINNFDLSLATNLDSVTKDSLIKVDDLFKDLEKLVLNGYMVRLVKNGIYLDERQIKTDKMFLVYNENNEFIALYEPTKDNKYKPLIIV